MPFGPVIPAASQGGGGGGSGTSLVFLTHTTAGIADSDTVDLNLALPSGVTRCVVCTARLTKISGDSVNASVKFFATASRDTWLRPIFGSAFGGVNVNAGSVPGPTYTGGGGDGFIAPQSYSNDEDEEFIRGSITNGHFSEDSSVFRLDLWILPIPTLEGEP